MIKLNENWALKADKYCWILENHYIGKNKKTGEPKPQVNTTYHGTLEQVAHKLLDAEVKECESIEAMYDKIDSLSKVILANVGERK